MQLCLLAVYIFCLDFDSLRESERCSTPFALRRSVVSLVLPMTRDLFRSLAFTYTKDTFRATKSRVKRRARRVKVSRRAM